MLQNVPLIFTASWKKSSYKFVDRGYFLTVDHETQNAMQRQTTHHHSAKIIQLDEEKRRGTDQADTY